jgi:hypothetical protein
MQWVIYIEMKKLFLTQSVDDKRVATTTIINIENGALSAQPTFELSHHGPI